MREIKKVAVLGSGVMGSGIAAHLANAGIPSLLLDIVPPKLSEEERADKAKRDSFATAAVEGLTKAKGAIQPLMDKRRASLITVGNFDDDLPKIADCDWIVEVVVERLDIKRSLFEKVAKYRTPGTIISSNTSGIDIASMVEGYPQEWKEHFLVTHFFNPVRYMRLFELVPGVDTLKEVVEGMAAFAETKLGKGIVYAKDTPNFIGNRIGVMAILDVLHVMEEEGLTVEEVDAVTAGPMGHKGATFKTADLVGLDTVGHIVTNSYASLVKDENRELMKLPGWAQYLIEKNWLGNKTKGGFYKKNKETKEKFVYDWKTKDYRLVEKVRADSLKIAKNTDDVRARVKAFAASDDKYGRFAWKLFARGFIYAINRVGEISDDIVNIDNAMKWGYNWEIGPFEVMDALGAAEVVARMKADGYAIPAALTEMVAKSQGSWYIIKEGKKYFWDIASKSYKPVPTRPQWFSLTLHKSAKQPIKHNDSASLHDMGDGVVLVEFHSKMNAIDQDIISMILGGIDLVESSPDYAGLVIANEGEHFSVGANVAMIMMGAMGGQFQMIEDAVKDLHKAAMRMRYSTKPVVVAPHGMALGGGCEMILAADAVVAHSELYAGLVELGVGLIPGGAGNKNLLIHYLENIPADMKIDRFPFVQRVFEQIGMAKVSLSAMLAKDMKILRHSDRIVMNRDEQIHEAKRLAHGMYVGGYRAPDRPDYLILPGKPGIATFEMGIYNMAMGGYVTEYEKKIAMKLANVLCGGDIEPNTAVTEEHLLDLEREAFMSLVGEPKTIERMQSILTTGKPLRN